MIEILIAILIALLTTAGAVVYVRRLAMAKGNDIREATPLEERDDGETLSTYFGGIGR